MLVPIPEVANKLARLEGILGLLSRFGDSITISNPLSDGDDDFFIVEAGGDWVQTLSGRRRVVGETLDYCLTRLNEMRLVHEKSKRLNPEAMNQHEADSPAEGEVSSQEATDGA